MEKKTVPKKEDEKKIKPTKYALKMKKKADELVAKHEYDQALAVLQESMDRDKTMEKFQNFMLKVQAVTDINNK